MKKLILFILIVICIDAVAQRQSENKFKLGFKIGMSSHTITGGRTKSGAKQSLIGGVWCQIKLSKKWTAQAEVIYVEKGTGGFDKNRSPRIGEYSISIMYLEFPVLFQFHLKKFTFESGLGLGALTYQYETLYGAPLPNMTSIYPFNTKEFSFNAGLGYSFNERWYLGLRFTHSILPVRKQIPDISDQVYNRLLAITVSRQLWPKTSKKKREE